MLECGTAAILNRRSAASCRTHPAYEKFMKRVSAKHAESIRKMTDLIRQACLVAKDSAFNVRRIYSRFLENGFSCSKGL